MSYYGNKGDEAKATLGEQLANFYIKWKPEFEGDLGWDESIDDPVIEIKKALKRAEKSDLQE